MKDVITCPKCGNVQQDNSEKCLKCGFRLDSYKNYLESVDAEVNGSSKKDKDKNTNFYEISPQWQQYVDRENARNKGKRDINPFKVIGILIVVIAIGSFVIYAINSGMFKNDDGNDNNTTNSSVQTSKSSNSDSLTRKSESENNTVSNNKLSFETQNAIRSAKDYLNFSAYSRKELILQLKFEGYSEESATEAVDSLNIDWNEQAALSAKAYLDFSAYSRSGLIAQLKFEGYTDAQAEYGAKAVGYGTEEKDDKIQDITDTLEDVYDSTVEVNGVMFPLKNEWINQDNSSETIDSNSRSYIVDLTTILLVKAENLSDSDYKAVMYSKSNFKEYAQQFVDAMAEGGKGEPFEIVESNYDDYIGKGLFYGNYSGTKGAGLIYFRCHKNKYVVVMTIDLGENVKDSSELQAYNMIKNAKW